MKKLNWLSSRGGADIQAITIRFWDVLSTTAYPISKGTMRVPISLEPFILSRQEYKDLNEKLLLVISAARKLAEHYFTDQKLRDVFSLNDVEVDFMEASKDEPFVGVVRADLFYGKEPKIVELNADFPDGFFMHDVTARSILGFFESRFETFSNTALFQKLLDSEGVGKEDHIFIGYDRGRKFIDEFAVTQTKLQKGGWKHVSFGAFEDLEYKNNAFYFNDKLVQAIRRGVETSKLRGEKELVSNIILLQKNSKLKVFNNFKMRLLGHKSLLAALWDKRFEKYLNEEEVIAVKTVVPETIKLETAPVREIESNKNGWVLKPSDLTEGEGVVIGSSCDEVKWSIEIQNALKNPKGWLLQRKVEIPKETFNIFDAKTQKVHSAEMNYDLDPHIVLFRDHAEMGNMLIRFSPSEILNVLRGGGLTYAFVNKKD